MFDPLNVLEATSELHGHPGFIDAYVDQGKVVILIRPSLLDEDEVLDSIRRMCSDEFEIDTRVDQDLMEINLVDPESVGSFEEEAEAEYDQELEDMMQAVDELDLFN